MQHLVFVYGTLRQGECNHSYLVNSQLLGHFETKAEFALYDLGPYPGLVEGHHTIRGEVYMVDDATLAKLDELEDVPVEYRRELIATTFGDAWIYIYQDSDHLDTLIESGDWCQRV
ncbi:MULTISPECIES: gamma-glutamylcyclotransferase family protein [Vibrio]|uniref:Gamma-glutamylcyclotransferase family protein n=2 Tax=Vibrio TaxID=662 RepID=A0A7X4RTT0_9VIBR|nr:gamma-glutamylcyclotransferase [Vibrio nitrifigilis]MBF9001707.1 gamma-glutamylcyclotransferase [Vibrio nitrifigilis]MZI92379.1 gamma-glutamylcyclotransferase [Vibrio eleionomae]